MMAECGASMHACISLGELQQRLQLLSSRSAEAESVKAQNCKVAPPEPSCAPATSSSDCSSAWYHFSSTQLAQLPSLFTVFHIWAHLRPGKLQQRLQQRLVALQRHQRVREALGARHQQAPHLQQLQLKPISMKQLCTTTALQDSTRSSAAAA